MVNEEATKVHNHIRHLAPIEHAFYRLKNELPKTLYYHTIEHSEDVLFEAILFGLHDKLSYREIYLLSLAAAYHDIGFIKQSQQNETICAEMAVSSLSSQQDLTEADLALIKQMILDTALQSTDLGPKQISTTPLSHYLLDADVSNLGRDDFFEKAELVRKEIGLGNTNLFYHGTLKLLDAHEWYTPAAQSLRTEQKMKNRSKLLEMISEKRSV